MPMNNPERYTIILLAAVSLTSCAKLLDNSYLEKCYGDDCEAIMKRINEHADLKKQLREAGYTFDEKKEESNNKKKRPLLQDGDVIYPTGYGGFRDYSKPGYVVDGDRIYPATYGGFRDYSKPGYIIDHR